MLKKLFTSNQCFVTFILPVELAAGASSASVIATFNKWDPSANPMQRGGETFTVTVALQLDAEYEYLYIVDGDAHNDWHADRYKPSPYWTDNSILFTHRLRATPEQPIHSNQ